MEIVRNILLLLYLAGMAGSDFHTAAKTERHVGILFLVIFLCRA
jgi:hypothetical protein